MTQTPPDMKIRLSASLRAQIEAAARTNNRTLNSEIISRLEASFSDPEGDARSAAAAQALLRMSGHSDPVNELKKHVQDVTQRLASLEKAFQMLSLNSDTYHLETRIRALEGKS